MAILYKNINPTSSDNVSNGYPIDSIWCNTITYDEFKQIADGVWIWNGKSEVLTSNNYSKTENLGFYINTTGGTVIPGDLIVEGTVTSINTAKTIQITSQTLLQANWVLVNGLYEYNYSNAAILDTSIVDVVPDNEYVGICQAANIYPKTLSSVGTVKFYSKLAPTGDIVVTINIYG
jgi:hypothetical protein